MQPLHLFKQVGIYFLKHFHQGPLPGVRFGVDSSSGSLGVGWEGFAWLVCAVCSRFLRSCEIARREGESLKRSDGRLVSRHLPFIANLHGGRFNANVASTG